jgi:hypothetical protein
MGGFRARDVDRERCVDVIESAYVDGQLGDQDRELRVSRALTAETLDELDALTRDLQNRPAAPAPAPVARPARAPARSTARSDSGGGPGIGKAVGAVAVLAFLAALVTSMQAPGSVSSVGSGDYAAVPWEQVETGAEELAFAMTPRRIREAVDAYESEFGTLEAFEVAFFPRRVVVQVPVPGARPRAERWTWDGTWTRDAGAGAVTGARGLVDLGAVDAARLVDNVALARRALRVEKGRFTHALLTRTGGGPTELDIHVGNRFNESGHLSTTPAGEILRRHPYGS